MTSDAVPKPRRSAAASFIFVTMLLDWLVVGMLSPVIPKLIVDFTGGRVDTASAISGAFATAFALVAFAASPALGILSDRFGRRPIILLASATTSAAYIADVTPPERRGAAFGMASAAFGLGFALGPAVGGLLAGFGLRVPFMVAAGLMLTNAAYGFFILPESLPAALRAPTIAWKRANPLGSLKLLRRHRDLFTLVGSLFCSNLAVQSFSVFVLYSIYRFNWSEQANGLGLTCFGAVSVASSMIVGRLLARFGALRVTIAGFALGSSPARCR